MIKNTYHKKKRVNGRIKYERVCVFCGRDITYFHGKKPSVCPHCSSVDYIKPPTETNLFLLQKQYVESGERIYLDKMFLILKDYAASIIKKLLPRDFRYHYDKIDEKAHDAASLLIIDYLNHPIGDYVIEASFGGYLRKKAQQVLWNKKLQNEEKHDSLDRVIDTSSNDRDLLSLMNSTNMQQLYGNNMNYHSSDPQHSAIGITDGVLSIINTIMDRIKEQYGYITAIQTLYGLSIKVHKGNAYDMDEYYHRFGSNLKDLVDKSLLIVYEYIKDLEQQ